MDDALCEIHLLLHHSVLSPATSLTSPLVGVPDHLRRTERCRHSQRHGVGAVAGRWRWPACVAVVVGAFAPPLGRFIYHNFSCSIPI